MMNQSHLPLATYNKCNLGWVKTNHTPAILFGTKQIFLHNSYYAIPIIDGKNDHYRWKNFQLEKRSL